MLKIPSYVHVQFCSKEGRDYSTSISTTPEGIVFINTAAIPSGDYCLTLHAATRTKTVAITL